MNELSVKASPAETVSSRSQALLQVSEAIAHHRELGELFHDLAGRLHDVAHFDYLNLVLHDPERQVLRLHLLETLRERPSHIRIGLELPIGATPSGRVFETQDPVVVPDVELEPSFPDLMETLRLEGVRSFCVVPLTTAQRRLGTLGFGKLEPHHYNRSEVDFMEQVARQVAVAVDNALNFETARAYQRQLARERDRLRVLLDINNALVSILDLRQLFRVIATSLQRVLHHEYTSLALLDPKTNRLRVRALEFPGGQGLIHEEMSVPIDKSPGGHALAARLAQRYTRADLERFDSDITRRLIAEGVRVECCVPLITRERVLGTLNVASFRDSAFPQEDQDLLCQVGAQVAIAVENALAFQEIAELKNKLTEEKLYLEDEIRTEHNFEEIVGESAVLKALLSQVQTVAPTDSTVLITGETGTGKELIARALHNLSARRDRTFVKINCAAIPTGLLESELFGHEKGAFTGAIAQKPGRFELADKGTLFLDEVADIPLELQPKLLRVLQEQEFERLGSTRTRYVDVRVVAATNRDLARMVDSGAFRSDLYYRLNVFPVFVPPLRERPEDIATLVRYFAQRYARRMNRHIETVSTETIAALERYHWPGNVRELENLIERAVILSPSPVLRIPVSELKSNPDGQPAGLPTLAEAERDHIVRALEQANWVLGGPKGAAAMLGMKRTTLQSRMQKLRISRPR
ncbi:MAG TPA: sigma 54-interacting transcriptional regulator [Terriglobales bacterium]|jgi:formate hydrogenlyase transcriptional activator|nr:sigma 54-interacting transcriptional regulator [Terriglobales bacterium]